MHELDGHVPVRDVRRVVHLDEHRDLLPLACGERDLPALDRRPVVIVVAVDAGHVAECVADRRVGVNCRGVSNVVMGTGGDRTFARAVRTPHNARGPAVGAVARAPAAAAIDLRTAAEPRELRAVSTGTLSLARSHGIPCRP
jgi:hypothetical protein